MPAYSTTLPRPGRPRFRALRLAILLLVLALVSLCEPRVFRFVVRHAITFETWRTGGNAQLGQVEGSLFDPIVLLDSVWAFRSRTGAVTRVEIARTTADVVWKNLFRQSANRCFQRLTFDGVTGKIDLPLDRPDDEWKPLVDLDAFRVGWLPLPSLVEARHVDFVFACEQDFVRLQRAHFRVSELEPGSIKAERLIIQQPWLRKSFPQVRGTTALQGSRIMLANLALEPGVVIQSFSAELGELAQGRLKQKILVAAFGGRISADGETAPENGHLNFVASGQFAQINIAQLAMFLGLSEAAGGTIKEGNFSFRGSPKNVARSMVRLRLNATNFQWESRQWDSLVFGAELIERRLQVHDFELHQGSNHLGISGDLTLPAPGQQWWQSDFQWNISAKIDNLTELSALLLPEFKYAAGKIVAEGSVRGRGEKFQGQLVVDGGNLQWRNAPIDELHATLKLSGNELQISNFNLFNEGDSVRGQGVVNILGPTQYWGMLRGSVDELGKYAALLQKPIVPEPLAGGATIDWSGEGSAKGHSGKFLARLRKLRPLGASAARLHPINAELEGSYAAGGMVFSKFALGDDSSSFTANVAVGNKALALQGIRLMHGQQLWLEGDALLPLDVWKAWPNTSLDTLLDDTVQSKVALNAYNLELNAASKLTGWNFPIEGFLRGTFTAEGPLTALKTGGKMSLSKARLPLGSSGLALTEIEGEAAFDGATLRLVKFTGKHPTGDLRASGQIDLANVRDVGLTLGVQSAQTAIALFRDSAAAAPVTLHAALDLQISGPASHALVGGKAQWLSLALPTAPDLAALWREERRNPLPAPFAVASRPARAWRFDVVTASLEPVPLGALGGTAQGMLRLTGTGAAPTLAGTITFQNIAASAGENPLTVGNATIVFRENIAMPTLDLSASGELDGEPFTAWAAGPLSQLVRGWDFPPSLTESAVKAALTGSNFTVTSLENETPFSLRVANPLGDDTEVFAWSISEPEPASAPPLNGVSTTHGVPEGAIQ